MFWRFGGYANVSTIDTILDKPDVTLEELLDESDLIQELKQHNTKLIEYLRDENVLRRLLEYVVAPSLIHVEDGENDDDEEAPEPPPKKTFSPVRNLSMARSREQKERTKKQEEREERDKEDKARQKHTYVACEVLSSETWSILEALMENQQHLRKFWEFLRRDTPLDPIAASYFTKINETLLEKKTEEALEFIKGLDGIIPAMLTHVDCPMVMDLLLKIISMEKVEGGQGIVDWLHTQDLMPLLLAYLGNDHPSFTQTAAGDFIKAIITISANASQNEQSCIGPNSLTRQLVSETCIRSLITDMLRGGNPLTVGVGIIIEVIRKNNSDYDPDVGAGQDAPPSSGDPIYLGTLLRMFAKHVPDFTELILSPNHTVTDGDSTKTIKRKELKVAFGGSIEPLGFDRFKTCELMAELLHCSNMGLLNERGSEAFVRLRDQEREMLKAEDALPTMREPHSAVTDFSEGSASFQHDTRLGSGSPEDIRNLEIANSAEEDGFEDVGASADLADEIKGNLEENSPFELDSKAVEPVNQVRPTKGRLDLDEEFLDEPLTSPRLEALDEKDIDIDDNPEALDLPEVIPLSELGTGVEGLIINKDAEKNNSPSSISTEETTADDPATATPPQMTNSDAPRLPQRQRNSNLNVNANETASPQDLSPHPDDRPPPLFADKTTLSPSSVENPPTKSSDQVDIVGNSQETIDTTQGEEGDSNRSVLLNSNDQSFAAHVENDVDGQPIVGDYLKMMFVEHQVVPTILDFFFRFPWNNFLHNVVYDVVQQVFNGPMDRGYNRSLAIDLFQTGRITERIIEGQLRSDEAQARNNMRLGYMGHLTLIAEEVVKFTERHTVELLSQAVYDKVSEKIWCDYVENALSDTRERDAAILGGIRPDVSGGSRQAVLNAVNAAHGFGNSGSSALANAGLNGGSPGLDSMDLANNNSNNNSSGSLGPGSGSLLSGFGSSSDDEDEEMDDAGEHEEGAGGGPDQYPTYAPSSLSALSIFSPPLENSSSVDNQSQSASTSSSNANPPPLPPPLNIPPSRARRQLAARLALKGASPFTSPQPSPNDQEPFHEGGESPLKSPSASSQAQASKDVVNAAIEGQKTETPFGDLSDTTGHEGAGGGQPGMAKLRDLYPEDFEHDDGEDVEGEEGHDVPITIALHPPLRSPTSSVNNSTTGRRISSKMNDLFHQGGSSSGSGSSDDDEEGDGLRGRVGVREARVRSALEEDGED